MACGIRPDRSSSEPSTVWTTLRETCQVFGERQPTQRQPLRIQRIVILGRFGQDFIRLGDGAREGLTCRACIPLPQGDDSVQGADIVIVFWHIIL